MHVLHALAGSSRRAGRPPRTLPPAVHAAGAKGRQASARPLPCSCRRYPHAVRRVHAPQRRRGQRLAGWGNWSINSRGSLDRAGLQKDELSCKSQVGGAADDAAGGWRAGGGAVMQQKQASTERF